MNYQTVKKLNGNRDLRCNDQDLGIGILNISTLRPQTGGGKIADISCILDEEGNWHDSPDSIAEVAISYFKILYSFAYPTHISEVLDAIPTKVTEHMNQSFIKEFTREEIEVALNQMHPTKAPGPDDMSAIFFKITGVLLAMMSYA